MTKNPKANGIIKIIPANGTNLLPPKNASIDGSSTSWKVLNVHDIINPIIIPAKIDVLSV